MRLLQINVTANWGSTGKIAEQIGRLAVRQGWESYIAYGRGNPESDSNLIRIGSDWDMRFHGLQTRLFDNHGHASRGATKALIHKIEQIMTDVIHLHNIHGYYLNYPLLFDFLKSWSGPIVWTLHDCWAFTGHCAYYDYVQCDCWQSACRRCPQQGSYPASFLVDRSYQNYIDKRASFQGVRNVTLVPVSNWLKEELRHSFLESYPAVTIHNGVNIDVFKPSSKGKDIRHIIGVASIWETRKGLSEFVKLREVLPEEYEITLVGLSACQIKKLPPGIKGITRTENVGKLVDLYSRASVFVNPTLEDNFPTTNIEALACGTPVVTYLTGGSPESIDADTGIVVEKGNIGELANAIESICASSHFSSEACRRRAEIEFDQNACFQKYIDLYDKMCFNTIKRGNISSHINF